MGRLMNPTRKKAIENGDKTFLRFCPKCDKETEWYTNATDGIGQMQRSKCRPCKKEYDHQRGLLPEVKEYHKWRKIKKKYGMSKDEWYWMYKEQGGRCRMCKKEIESHNNGVGPSTVTACVDHDHKTDRVRGILCSSCNLLLGYANDDVNLLRLGIIYLEETTRINDI